MTVTHPIEQRTHAARGQTPARQGPLRVAAWSFVVTGVGHAAIVVASRPPRGQAAVLDAMRRTTLSAPPHPSLYALLQGFSVAMALLFVAFGALLLATLRAGPATRAHAYIAFAAAAGLLVIAVLWMPAPPIATMSVAVLAAALALRRDDNADAVH